MAEWRGVAACPVCGRRVRLLVPAGGDGSGEVFAAHKHREERCPGSRTLYDGPKPPAVPRKVPHPDPDGLSRAGHDRGRNVGQGIPRRPRTDFHGSRSRGELSRDWVQGRVSAAARGVPA